MMPVWRAVSFPRSVGGVPTALQRRGVYILSYSTPNPSSKMFMPNANKVLGKGHKTRRYTNKFDTHDSPLAETIFRVHGVSALLLGAEHVTVTKSEDLEWDHLEGNVKLVMSQFFAAGIPVMKVGAVEEPEDVQQLNELEEKMFEIIEERVKPVVQQDGGDIDFDYFDPKTGKLYLRMVGACAGCPQSSVTLKLGIKRLMQHYIPEVKDVVSMDE